MLIDSEVISANVLIDALRSVGIHVDFDYVQAHFLGRSWTKVAAEIRASHGYLPGTDFEQRYRSQLLDRFERELKPTSGIRELLDKIAAKICVATSSSPKRASRSLQLAGLADHFDGRIFTASQVDCGKPAPDLFLFAASHMQVDPARCLVIEDSAPGIQAAMNAGMRVLRFTGASHLRKLDAASLTLNGAVACFDKWEQFLEMAPQAQLPSGGRMTP